MKSTEQRKRKPSERERLSPRLSDLIGRVREYGCLNGSQLAKRLGVTPTAVSAWEAGSRVPSAESWVKLAALAAEKKDFDAAMELFHEARLPARDVLLLASAVVHKAGSSLRTELGLLAREIEELRLFPATPGEQASVPQYRETPSGRVLSGPEVALPAEFVPYPLSTILLSFEEDWPPLMEEKPGGVFLLDTSAESAVVLSGLFGIGLGVMVRYRFKGDLTNRPKEAVYVGGLSLDISDDLAPVRATFE